MERLSDLWQLEFLWNPVSAWVLALAAFLATFIILPLVKRYITAQRRRMLQTQGELPLALEVATRMVTKTSRLFITALALYLAATQLHFPAHIERGIEVAVVLAFWFQVGLWGMAAVRLAVERQGARARAIDPTLAGSLDIVLFVGGLAVWSMALLLALDNLGIQIGPLLAGLGIGGIAVALAVQTILSDLLASMSIALDKPFVVGDTLAIDNFTGTVEHIGVKSTRLRSPDGEQIVMSNADILRSRLRNFARMRERRSVFRLNIAYNTPLEKLRVIPDVVREIVEAQPNARFERCHFLAFTDWSLQFEVAYTLATPDYNVYANTQQTINLTIIERFESMGIQLAIPARPFYTPPQGAST
ncbi:MAG TPA: mechanosensitive ion channel domain-containing protein [Steroidobacteraceae bacterium]